MKIETNVISQPAPMNGQFDLQYNGTWKLYTKAKTSPITATISAKQLVFKPITIMSTIFQNNGSVVS
jgi:hypothetical protein